MADFLVDSDPKVVSPQKYKERFLAFLYEQTPGSSIEAFLQMTRPRDDQHHAWYVSAQDVIHFDPALAFTLLHHPGLLLPLFEEAFQDYQQSIAKHPSFEKKHGVKGQVKKHVHIRLVSIPPIPDFIRGGIGQIRANEVDSLLQITGTVVRIGAVKMLEISKQYQCTNSRCNYTFRVYADPEQDNMLPFPRACPRVYRTDPSDPSTEKRCNCANLREVEDARVCVDYQEIKVQDHIEHLTVGSVPRSIAVSLQADLVDRFNPGDDVIVVGTVIRQWKYLQRNARPTIDIMLQANNIMPIHEIEKQKQLSGAKMEEFAQFWQRHRSLQRELYARDLIVKSVCPQLYGMFFIKLSLLLALIGGVDTNVSNGVRRRSTIHMLMVGDPGCGKSQLLRFAAAVMPRSVLTTGIGTTGAGLTCTAVRDGGSKGGGGEWSLEAGALVLSNGGVCCIDEFNSIKEADRATIHEAMEQQTLSIAKAGLVVKLQTKTTIVASCNPKGSYDVASDISANTNIASPLLSRFDIILVLIDTPKKEWDKLVSTFLLSRALGDYEVYQNSNFGNAKHWDIDTLQKYIATAKTLQPVLSPEARILLMRYYNMQRQSDDRSSARTTIRLLESLIRLSEAHARLMFRDMVDVMDAIIAILIVSQSQSKLALLDDDSDISKEDFAPDPDQWYAEREAKIFNMLNYSQDKLAKDVARLHAQSDNKYSVKVEISIEDEIAKQRMQEEQVKSQRVFEANEVDDDVGF